MRKLDSHTQDESSHQRLVKCSRSGLSEAPNKTVTDNMRRRGASALAERLLIISSRGRPDLKTARSDVNDAAESSFTPDNGLHSDRPVRKLRGAIWLSSQSSRVRFAPARNWWWLDVLFNLCRSLQTRSLVICKQLALATKSNSITSRRTERAKRCQASSNNNEGRPSRTLARLEPARMVRWPRTTCNSNNK